VRLWPLLLQARTCLASLDGTGKHLPVPNLVMRPLQNREAQKSNILEGTFVDPHQQILFELDPQAASSEDDPRNSFREVANYSNALRMRWGDPDALPLSLRLLRNLHARLMQGVRGGDKSPGEFRRTQNQIGRPARYVPPPVTELAGQLDNLEKYLHADPPKYDPLVRAFLVHYQFEAIHPFLDGNGRVGRLLLAILIQEWCGLANQWLYMSDYFEKNKDSYFDLLFRVSAEGAWHDWIEFCLTGVVEQANDTTKRCEQLISLNREFHQRVNEHGGSVRLSRLVDGLFISPVAIVSQTAKAYSVTYPTARSDLSVLADLGILEQLVEAGQISYYCPQIFSITYQD